MISPFNFPAMVPMWFFPIAIATGNTRRPQAEREGPVGVANWMAELMAEAGLPAGVFNVVHGDKEAVDALLTHPDVASISFVGSTPIAKYVYETGTAHGKRVQALGGAKNHMLVLPDADLDLVADSAVNAGFGSAGERCMAISVVLAVDSVADALIEKIRDADGAPSRPATAARGCDMGPLITREHRDKVASYVDVAATDGATVVVDGRDAEVDGDADGFWIGPDPDRQGADHLEGLHRRDLRSGAVGRPGLRLRRGRRADQLRARTATAPRSSPTTAAPPAASSARSRSGWSASTCRSRCRSPTTPSAAGRPRLFGDAKAYGPHGVDFFTREKADHQPLARPLARRHSTWASRSTTE